MMMRKFAATAAMLVAAVGVAAGTANADPAAPAAPESVYYKASVVDNDKAVIKTDGGSIVNENGMLEIKAANGAVLAGTPLNFRVDDFEFPIAADISGNTATLTPQYDVAHAVYKPVALPFEDSAPWKTPYDRETAAFNRLKDTISTGATIGTLAGGIGGAVIGCVAGAAIGLAATGALLALFGAGPLGGCVAGAAAVGFLGVLAGQIFVTAPVAIGAAIQYFATTTAPFKPAPSK